jgi:Flp pilus assembly protein protease CpaA
VTLQLWLFTVLSVALLVCLVTDLRGRGISDRVTLPAALALLALRAGFEGLGDESLGVLGGLAGGGPIFLLFWLIGRAGRGVGRGDARLMGVVGLAFGMPGALTAAALVALVGAAQALVQVLWQGRGAATFARLWRTQTWAANPAPPQGVPYGVSIALGSFWAMAISFSFDRSSL